MYVHVIDITGPYLRDTVTVMTEIALLLCTKNLCII